MSEAYVLDSSAVLAVIFGEPGADRVVALLDGARISAVNHQEVIAKQIDRNLPERDIRANMATFDFEIVPLDVSQAERAGWLRRETRRAGLSLGDRSCLALAAEIGGTVVTTDHGISAIAIGVGIDVMTIR